MKGTKWGDDGTARPLVALGVGVAVALMAYLIAFQSLRDLYPYRPWLIAWGDLERLEGAIEDYRKTTGHLPVSLAELDVVKRGEVLEVDGQGRPLGPLGHAFQYRAEGNRYTLFWPGMDGEPGGVGTAADVYPRSSGRRIEPATLRQFTVELATGSLLWSCILAGGFAGLACLEASRKSRGVGFVASVVTTTVATLFMASIMAAFHYPSGH